MRNRSASSKNARNIAQGPSSGSRRRGRSPASRLIEPDVEIAKDAGRDAPDVSVAERDGVVLADAALPLAGMDLVVCRVHQEGQRHLEGVGDLMPVEGELET